MAELNDKNSQTLGIKVQTVGKTQARRKFFPLVDSLKAADSAVTITDHDKPVAVLLSYQNYVALTAKANFGVRAIQPKGPNLLGSIKIKSDLEKASADIGNLFASSLKDSAGKI